MKKYFSAIMFFIMLVSLHADSMVWNKTNNFDGWRHFFNCKGKTENGVMTFYNILFDPSVRNHKVSIDPTKYDTFVYTYRTNGNKKAGQLYFTHLNEKFSHLRMWPLPPLIGDNQWHTVKVKPKNLTSWLTGGTITALRFDPTDSAGGTVEISEIRLEKSSDTAVSAVPVAATTEEYKLDKNNKFGGQVFFARCAGKVADGMIKLTTMKADNSIYFSKLNIDPAKYDYMTFTYRANGIGKAPGQLYFSDNKLAFNGRNYWKFGPLIADGKWHTIEVKPQNLQAWQSFKKYHSTAS